MILEEYFKHRKEALQRDELVILEGGRKQLGNQQGEAVEHINETLFAFLKLRSLMLQEVNGSQ